MYDKDIHRIYTTPQTETDDRGYSIEQGEKPHCMYWEAVRKVNGSHESTAVLGIKRWPL